MQILNEKDLNSAKTLANTILARGPHMQPIPLSQQETVLLCLAIQTLVTGAEPCTPRIPFTNELEHLNWLGIVLDSDENGILHAEESYRGSWKRRGGIGAFMMLARKWDRLESRTAVHNYNIFDAIALDKRREGVIDDVRDLRRYLTLVECQMILSRDIAPEGGTKDSDAVR